MIELVIKIPESQYKTLNAKTQADVVDVIDDKALIDAIKNGKTVSKGKWIRRHYITADKTFDMYVCSNCKEEFSYDAETGVSIHQYDFCPNCGADMSEVKE